MELIPGLPNDVSVECLIRLDFNHLSNAASVTETWNSEIRSQEFWNQRRAAGFTRPVLVIALAKGKPAAGNYCLVVSDPERGYWDDLPPIPGLLDDLPIFCRIVGVGTSLVVMGGCDPITWKVLNSVFIFDFLSGKWRHGASIPGKRRFFFGCASDSERRVIVAGGHDNQKHALRSAMLYDVLKDEWVTLPDMARERDECACIFNRGKFHVIGGYSTYTQGVFVRDVEVLEDQTKLWSLNDGFMDMDMDMDMNTANCPVHDGGFYLFESSYLMTCGRDKLLAMGYEESDGCLNACYVINLKDMRSKKIEIPADYRRHVQSACCLEI